MKIMRFRWLCFWLLSCTAMSVGCLQGTEVVSKDPDVEPDREQEDPVVKDCTEDLDCGSEFKKCDEGTCVKKSCLDISCDRGVCDRETLLCVNASDCTPETAPEVCLKGYVCLSARCVVEDEVCQLLNCGKKRGVCSKSEQACVNASPCTEDRECLVGNYCKQGQCFINHCMAENGSRIQCKQGFTCNPDRGKCEEITRCDADNLCKNGQLCVQGSCLPEGNLCQGACTGNQTCGYDEATQVAACEEPGQCEIGLDCLGDRVCEGGRCGDGSGSCEEDDFDAAGIAVDFYDAVRQRGNTTSTLSHLTLCRGDEDRFIIDTSEALVPDGRLDIRFKVTEGMGNGSVTLVLLSEDGSAELMSWEITAHDMRTQSVFEFEYVMPPQTPATGQKYQLKLQAMEAKPTIIYDLTVQVLDRQIYNMCQNARTLVPNVPLMQGSFVGGHVGYRPPLDRCRDSFPASTQRYTTAAHTFTLSQSTWVKIDVTGVRFVTLSLTKGSCEESTAASKANQGLIDCYYDNILSSGAPITLNKLLAPGDYTVLVTRDTDATGDDYNISMQTRLPECDPSQDQCLSDGLSLKYCNQQGQFETTTCALGCNTARNECTLPAHDNCQYLGATVDLGHSLSGEFDLDDFKADYSPKSCSGLLQGKTDLADMIIKVDVGTNEVLDASVVPKDFYNAEDLVLYLQDQCASDTCIASENKNSSGQKERLIWKNTGAAKSLYLVIDSSKISYGLAPEFKPFDLDVSVKPSVCQPNLAQCRAGSYTHL